MKFLITSLLFYLSIVSYGQTRVNITNGIGAITQTGFAPHNITSLSFITDVKENFSLSFGASFMTPRNIYNRKDFYHCDSFEHAGGWYPACVDGFDTSVNSSFYYAYKKTEIGIHVLWRRGKNNQNFTGLGLSGVFFSRRQFIEDEFIEDRRLETGKSIALSVMHIKKIPIFKPESGVQLILNFQGGILYSHQEQCTDFSCDNFFEGPLQFIGNLQVGFSFDLN